MFEGHMTLKAAVEHLVDGTHPALPKQADNLIALVDDRAGNYHLPPSS
jgi:hypothetical protein